MPSKKAKGKGRASFSIWGWVALPLFIVALYCVVGFVGIPYYVSKVLPEHFHDKTGMVLESSAITFNPFTFRFAAGESRILSESGSPVISFQSLHASIAPASFWRLEILCNNITASALDLSAARELDGSYNFRQLLGKTVTSKLSEIISFSNFPFFFSLNNVSIENGRIIFKDTPTGKVHTVEDIQLDLPSFSNTEYHTEQYLRPHFSAIVNGSPVELTGQARADDSENKNQATRLSLDIKDLDLTNYIGYLPFSLPMDFKKGRADGIIELVFDPQNTAGDKFSVGLELQISGAELAKANRSISIIVPTARIIGGLQPVSRRIHLKEITLKEPTVSSFGDSFLQNIKQPAKQEGQPPPPDSTTVSLAPYSLTIDQFLMDDASFRLFTDQNGQKPQTTWTAMQLSVMNYHIGGGNIKQQKSGSFSLSGEKEGSQANFTWQGAFSSMESLAGTLTLDKINCDEIHKLIGSDHPFTLKGVADLKGQLTFFSKKESPGMLRYKVTDAEIAIENFSLMDKKRAILTAPMVKFVPLTLEDDSINFGNILFEKGAAHFIYGQVPAVLASFTSKKYQLQGIDFEGNVTFVPEGKSEQPLAFTNVSLKANGLDSAAKKQNNISVSGQTETGGIFKAQGDVTLAPFGAHLKTGFRDIPAKRVFHFFTRSQLFTDIKGDLSGKGQLELPTKRFFGEIQLTDFSGNDPKKNDLSWQKAVFQNVQYTATPFHLGMASAQIDQARFTWEITRTDNGPMHILSDFFQKYVPKADNTQNGSSPVNIKEISFSNTNIKISDRRLTPDWIAETIDFAGTITDIDSGPTKRNSTFSFTGKLDDTPFALSGELNPFSSRENGTFRFTLDNYPLASFYKQLSSKTDLDISSGELQLTLDCFWRDQQYKSSGNLVLSDLKPVSATSDLALPLALLTGPDETLRLPFEFSRTAPVAKTTLYEELLSTFQTLIVKGSVSPLLLATGDFTDLIDKEAVEFLPGEFMLSESGREVLTRYATLLKTHPHVGIILSGGVDIKIDGMAMKDSLTSTEQQRVEKANEKRFQEWQDKKNLHDQNLAEKQKRAAPNGIIVEQDIPVDILTGFIPLRPEPVVVDDEMLLDLGQKRINILYQYFTTQLNIEHERISIAQQDSLSDESSRPNKGVIITLKAISR